MHLFKKILPYTLCLLFIYSCSKDSPSELNPDDNPVATCSDGLQNGDEVGIDCGGSCSECVSNDPSELGGSITEEFILDPSVTYTLNSALVVRDGGTLIIPEGTTIQVESGSENHILVEQGGDLVISGTEQTPVTMELKPGFNGAWGGLIIAGNAPVTSGENTLIAGSTATYGGNEPADNSGSISYLIIKNAGDASSSGEIGKSALALYGLGTATTIDHVAIFDTNGDALRISGGTLRIDDIYIENAQNHALFWSEGWSGTLNNILALNKNDFNTIVSANGINAYPNLSNFTAITEQDKTAFEFKNESGANITGLALIGFNTSFELLDGVMPSNIVVDGEVLEPELPYIANSKVEQSNFNWAGELATISFITVAGEITSDITFDASTTYFLTGSLHIKNGATLTINEGTEIIADVETGNFTSTYIAIEQGARIEILGTSQNPVLMRSSNGEPGDWGGLILAGSATTTAGSNVSSEIGDLKYGGNADDDSSGSINHLILKHTGANISPDTKYNGLSLYGVGSNTTIDNVAIIDGSDDGIEIFGGTTSLSNLYLENLQDDSVQWTEGWSGSINDALVLHTISDFSSAVEADGMNSNPELNNITCISENEGVAIQFNNGSGATITGLSLLGYTNSFDFSNNGNVANVTIESEAVNINLPYIASPTVNTTAFDWVADKAQINSMVITGELMSDLELNPQVTYYLDGIFSVQAGSTLTIPAGTNIIADVENGDETSTYIVVQKNGLISVNGTATEPVLMTSSNNNTGDWGGLIIAGNGITSAGVDAEAEVGGIVYGGNDNADSSGNINYLLIENTGAMIDPESEYSGLSLYAVGSGTTIENIAILNGNDDGVEFFGGAVSIQNLYLKNNGDDAIDWVEEWSGDITNIYIELNNSFSSVLEAEGNQSRPSITNITAISSEGGNAMTFRQNSGATIEGLALEGFDSSLIMVDGAPLSNVNINGANADPNNDYELNSNLDMTLFDWVPNN